jgi:hypothetical protein
MCKTTNSNLYLQKLIYNKRQYIAFALVIMVHERVNVNNKKINWLL